LNQKYLYLALNILTILVPFVFSFYAKANFSKKWKYLSIAILVPGAIFIAWDEFFTRLGIWGFNEKYLSGIYLGSLPLEEILFFICVPYACVFTHFALNYLVRKDFPAKADNIISIVLITGSLLLAIINFNKWYTCATFLALGEFILILKVFFSMPLSRFYFTYLVVLIPFFIINGILTGSWIDDPVVWYNDSENLGIRIGTIPIEDIFYGMLLTLMNVSLFERMQKRN
jgi:lycopene cyclase domain-containing protein